jgi:hypothetical protein
MMQVDIVHGSADALIAKLGAAGLPEFAPILHGEQPSGSIVCAALLRRGSASTLLDAHRSNEPIRYRDDLFPYHTWHGEQATVTFWQAAFSWTLYWRTVLLGQSGDPCWMDRIMTPLSTPPFLGFLDVSCGRFAWDFQLELAYRLADDDGGRAIAFRKAWNAQQPEARRMAASISLADGHTLLETLCEHAPYGTNSVGAVPVRAAQLLVKL